MGESYRRNHERLPISRGHHGRLIFGRLLRPYLADTSERLRGAHIDRCFPWTTYSEDFTRTGGSKLTDFVESIATTLLLISSVFIVAVSIRLLKVAEPFNGRRQHAETRATRFHGAPVAESLKKAIDEAVQLNAAASARNPDPLVRLQSAVRLSPTSFAAAVADIPKGLREGRIVSIDLSMLDPRQARRLVDFCSGATSMCSGWIFHMTETAIILTPGMIIDQ
jgi:FtsZ-interacting cell division protein YlmF